MFSKDKAMIYSHNKHIFSFFDFEVLLGEHESTTWEMGTVSGKKRGQGTSAGVTNTKV